MHDKKSIKYRLAEKKVLIPLSAFLFIGILLASNFILNSVLELMRTTLNNLLDPKSLNIEWNFFLHMPFKEHPIYYMIACLLAFVGVAKVVYDLRSNFKDLNKNQKGSSRWTEEKELKQHYKSVPEKTERYPGGGGVVISRFEETKSFSILIQQMKKVMEAKGIEKWSAIQELKKNKVGKLCIDDSPVNNLIIGTTRSGKGETFVFPTIDVYSRAENQPSLINNDPKGELYAASKATLEQRGYHIEVLNLLNPIDSMSYNPLQLVIDAYKEGDYSAAQALCKTLTYTLYYNPNAKDPFWQQCAMSLANAMILATVDKCIKEGTEEKITMYTVGNMLSELGSTEIENEETGELENALDMYFQKLPADSVAKMQYATSNFSKGTTRGGIFTQTMNGLSIFTFDEIAKMTAENSVDLKRVGFGKTIKGTAKPRERVEIHFPDGSTETVKCDTQGFFELDFKQKIKSGDKVEVFGKESAQRAVVKVVEIDEKTGDTELKVIKTSKQVHIKKLVCFEKPIAIFMITPDYDESNHVIASIFVRQLYFILAKGASLARGSKCHREVVFLLDEFGNMPAIEGMANIITVCLGRNIRFNLIIQAYAQLKNKYGENAPTIDGNCGNTIYILTNDEDTAEKISKKLGNQTINTVSRSGKALSTDKSKTESVDQRPLLTAAELKELEEGESVVLRVIKRQDKNRNRIKARPIYNTGKTKLKYRWEYLNDDFNTDKSILDIDIPSIHADIEPKSLLVNYLEEILEEEEVEENEEKNQENKTEIEENPKSTNDENVEKEEDIFQEKKAISPSNNWGKKTVLEFFESDMKVLSLVEKHFVKHLNKGMDQIKQQSMEEFNEQFLLLSTNDHINKALFQAVTSRIKKIKKEMEEETRQVS